MMNCEAFLEVDSTGRTVAHVLAVPGCFAVGETEAAALTAISQTLQTHFPEQRITASVAEKIIGSRVIFTPERQPISSKEVESYLERAAHNRAELLALVRPLVPTMRNWKPFADRMSINDILRHVGGAEWWYVTRLLGELSEPESAPALKFLAQTRQTAVTHLRQLTDEQRAAVISQSYRSRIPQEEWSARKLLRRLLEHEQEHIAHIREILAEWRAHYLAQLYAERAGLLWQLRGLSEESLLTSEVIPGWTIKNLVVHLAHYDAVLADRMQKVVDARAADIQPIADDSGPTNYNAALLAQIKETPLEQAVAMLLKERSGFQALLKRIPDTDLQRRITLPWGWRTSMRVWANWRYRHDREHGQQIAAWRAVQPVAQLRQVGPKYVLRPLLQATRHEFTCLLALLPQAEWTTRPVCGVWTMKDLLGHLTDWEKVAVDGMRQLAAGQTPEFAYELNDFEQFNQDNAAQRKEQPWDEIWADFLATRDTLLALLAETPEAMLARYFALPWGGELPGYAWMLIWPGHEREHAVDVRAALQLQNWPKGLVRHG